MKITAVVVTYNRLELLKRVIESLKKQTFELDKIVIINNGSTDGTKDWLSIQDDIIVIEQDNLGSSGGQYSGFKHAYDNGAEWIWAMDDDVIHTPTCLQNLIIGIKPNRIHCPLRYANDGNIFFNDTVKFNFSNPFKGIWKEILIEQHLSNEFISIEGGTFEGPLFHRSLIETIGLPEKNFFIYGDDSEYFIRANNNNFKAFIVKNARSNRLLDYDTGEVKFGWKNYYIIRNIIAIDKRHGNLLIRTIRPMLTLTKWILKSNNINDIKTTFKAVYDGIMYKYNN